jgi:hypothetical protein
MNIIVTTFSTTILLQTPKAANLKLTTIVTPKFKNVVTKMKCKSSNNS